MTTTEDERRLVGTWFHLHEEDTPTVCVYRPADYDFPPARGRRGYEFRADHTGAVLGIAARDGWARTPCQWQMTAGEPPAIRIAFQDGRTDRLQVESLDPDRLVLRR